MKKYPLKIYAIKTIFFKHFLISWTAPSTRYCTVPWVTWKIFKEFLIFCILFLRSLGITANKRNEEISVMLHAADMQ